jgi:hypothetical protein
MNATQLIHEIEQLPSEAQQQIEEFINSIKSRYSITSKKKLSEEEFVGLWEYKKDIQDSSQWVRNTRQAEWSKNND